MLELAGNICVFGISEKLIYFDFKQKMVNLYRQIHWAMKEINVANTFKKSKITALIATLKKSVR